MTRVSGAEEIAERALTEWGWQARYGDLVRCQEKELVRRREITDADGRTYRVSWSVREAFMGGMKMRVHVTWEKAAMRPPVVLTRIMLNTGKLESSKIEWRWGLAAALAFGKMVDRAMTTADPWYWRVAALLGAISVLWYLVGFCELHWWRVKAGRA